MWWCDSVTFVSDGCLATCNRGTAKSFQLFFQLLPSNHLYIMWQLFSSLCFLSNFVFLCVFFLKTLSEMQDKRVHPNKKVFLTLLNSLSKRGHHGLIREVCTLNVERLAIKNGNNLCFLWQKLKKWGEKTVIIKYYNQASMSRIMQFRYQVYVMALLQTNLLLVYLFFCERKAVLVQWRSDVNNINFLLVMALSWESHSREIQSKNNSVCENTIGSWAPVIIYYYHTIIIIIIIITLLQFAFICLLAPEPNHGSETLEEFLFNLLDWEGLSQNVCCSQK